MKKETRKKTYEKEYAVYVTEDGAEFDSKYKALYHEISMQPERDIPWYYIDFETLDDIGADCYYIKDESDLKYLFVKQWDQHASWAYSGEGWYMAICHAGGDYPDSYEIVKLDEYKKMLENDLAQINDLTKS